MEVYCFSGAGHSRALAEYFAGELGCTVKEIRGSESGCSGTAVVVFPVYCQNIPEPVRAFLDGLRAENVALIATYGRISFGNVLQEAQKLLQGQVIAGVCFPMGHTFLGEDCSFDPEPLRPVVERIREPRPAGIPGFSKDFIADIFPAWRSRAGVKIIRSESCTDCNICGQNCPMGAIRAGVPGSSCIRCMKCVTGCPQKALTARNSRILDRYLHSRKKDELLICL